MAAGYVSAQLNLDHPSMGGSPVPLTTQVTNVQHWTYITDTDAIATVIAAGYITDGDDKGMKVGDVVTCVDTNIPAVDLCVVSVVSAAGLVTMIQLA